MRVAGHEPPLHLTYCTNIHPAETWAQVMANLEAHVLAVKARVSPQGSFGVGLRLSASAAEELGLPAPMEAFRAFLQAHDLYVFTINGFPYGTFHGAPVKERVYRPDWLEDERLAYSDSLARILATLLPDGMEGSVSTVPGCFRPRGEASDARLAIADRLLRHARVLWRLKETTGRTIGLALEPEPRCLLESSREAVAFMEEYLFSARGIQAFSAMTGLHAGEAEAALRRHLGVCFDACHAAVEFEPPVETLNMFSRRGIRILKVQVSAGLRVPLPNEAARRALRAFCDDVYLHQVVVRDRDEVRRYLDLPGALAEEQARWLAGADGEEGGGGPEGSDSPARNEWRVHFHVPLFQETLGHFRNTHAFLVPMLERLARGDLCNQLEVETYTWDVLPEQYRTHSVVEAISRELEWTIARLGPGKARG